jgi:hypothetical protein
VQNLAVMKENTPNSVQLILQQCSRLVKAEPSALFTLLLSKQRHVLLTLYVTTGDTMALWCQSSAARNSVSGAWTRLSPYYVGKTLAIMSWRKKHCAHGRTWNNAVLQIYTSGCNLKWKKSAIEDRDTTLEIGEGRSLCALTRATSRHNQWWRKISNAFCVIAMRRFNRSMWWKVRDKVSRSSTYSFVQGSLSGKVDIPLALQQHVMMCSSNEYMPQRNDEQVPELGDMITPGPSHDTSTYTKVLGCL